LEKYYQAYGPPEKHFATNEQQLRKGVIQNFTSDGTPTLPVTCSDGFFQIMNQYPERQVSRQCWKAYNDGVNCPWATKGSRDL
jgi:hypothetical protein